MGRCKKCGKALMMRKAGLCRNCNRDINRLLGECRVWIEKLHAIFTSPGINEDEMCIIKCLEYCEALAQYESLGFDVVSYKLYRGVMPICENVSELREELMLFDKKIKEGNDRKRLYDRANSRAKAYDFEEALEDYRQLNRMYPSHIGPILSMAEMYRKMNRLDLAIKVLLEAKRQRCYRTNVSYRHNLDKLLKDLVEKEARGYIYRPRR